MSRGRIALERRSAGGASPSANPVSAPDAMTMKKLFWVPMTLGLAAYVLLPLPGRRRPLSERIEEKRAQVEQGQAQGGRPHPGHPALQQPDRRPPGRDPRHPAAAHDRAGRARRQRARSCSQVRDDLEVARDRLERAALELDGRAAAPSPTGWSSSTRPTSPTPSPWCSRPTASPTCSSAPSSSSGSPTRTAEIVDAREGAEGEGREGGGAAGRARGAQAGRGRDDPAPPRRHRVSTRDRLASAQGELRTERNGRRTVARRGAPAPRRGPRRTWPRMEREQARIRSALAGRRRAAALPGRSGGHRPADLAGQRHGHARRSACAGAACTPASTSRRPPARRSAPPTRAAWRSPAPSGGYGNYTCIQHGGSMSTCYAHQSSFGVSVGRA